MPTTRLRLTPTRRGRPNRLHALAFALFAVLWTIALLVPIPKESASQVLGGESGMYLFGKALHVGAYAFLTVLGGTLALTRGQRWLLLAGLVLHAGLTEFVQGFVGRGPSVRDAGFDCLGVLIGVIVAWKWWRGLFR